MVRPRVRALIIIMLLVAVAALFASRPATAPAAYDAPRSAERRYVTAPQNASVDMRREAAYLARKYELPLITESTAVQVEIRRFEK